MNDTGYARQFLLRVLETLERAFAGDRLDAAHARGNRTFVDDFADADIAGAADVRASAKLLAEIGDGDDAHFIAVFFAEQRHRAGGQRLIQIHHVGVTSRLSRICSFISRSTSAISSASIAV